MERNDDNDTWGYIEDVPVGGTIDIIRNGTRPTMQLWVPKSGVSDDTHGHAVVGVVDDHNSGSDSVDVERVFARLEEELI